MNITDIAKSYIATHALNIGADVIQHIKAFAAHVESQISSVVDTVQADVKEDAQEVVSDIQAEVPAVESALEELAEHAPTAFADLLAAQSSTESK